MARENSQTRGIVKRLITVKCLMDHCKDGNIKGKFFSALLFSSLCMRKEKRSQAPWSAVENWANGWGQH